MYTSFLGISEALHLDIFHQPLTSRFFDSLVSNPQCDSFLHLFEGKKGGSRVILLIIYFKMAGIPFVISIKIRSSDSSIYII